MLPPLFQKQFEAYQASHCRESTHTKARWDNLSASYREGRGRYTQQSQEHMAYVFARMPGTFAACEAVLAQAGSLGLMSPATVLDLGAGPGTMGWALSEREGGEQIRLTQVEKDPVFREFCIQVQAPLKQIDTVPAFLKNEVLRAHEWVSMAYVLCELSSEEQEAWVAKAFSLAGEVLLLIEPGTPTGYGNILRAREQLTKRGGFVLAPCPHQGVCPLQASDWCHFPVRFERTPEGRKLKQGTLPYEDEKFSYLIVVKDQSLLRPYGGRVIRHPMPRSGHIHLDICTSKGAYEKVTISAKSRDIYKASRSLKWGDEVP